MREWESHETNYLHTRTLKSMRTSQIFLFFHKRLICCKGHQDIWYRDLINRQTSLCIYIHYNILLKIWSDILSREGTNNTLHEPNLSAEILHIVRSLLQQAGQIHGLATGHQPPEDSSFAWLPQLRTCHSDPRMKKSSWPSASRKSMDPRTAPPKPTEHSTTPCSSRSRCMCHGCIRCTLYGAASLVTWCHGSVLIYAR